MATAPITTSDNIRVHREHCCGGQLVTDALEDVSCRQICTSCHTESDNGSTANGVCVEDKADVKQKFNCGGEIRIDHSCSDASSQPEEVCLQSSISPAVEDPSITAPFDTKWDNENSMNGTNSSTTRHEEALLKSDSFNTCFFLPSVYVDKGRSHTLNSCENILVHHGASSSTMHGLPTDMAVGGHPASAGNMCTCCTGNCTSWCNPLSKEDLSKTASTTVDTSQDRKASKSADCLLENWCSEKEHFIWFQCKAETICIFVSFNLLLVLIVEAYWMTGRNAVELVFPWIATLICGILLLGALLLDFLRSQALSFYVSPLLFLSAILSWLIPSVFFTSDSEAESGFFAVMGLLVSISLPWLLSAVPIMARQIALLLSLLMPFLNLAWFLAQSKKVALSMDSRAIFPFVLLLATTNILLCHLRSAKLSRVLQLIESWASAFHESKEHEKQAHAALEERERDNADRISKMRHFISYIFHEIRVPFNAVMLGIGHLLASDISEKQHEVLNMMDLSCCSMIRILNDVLDMGKIEAGKLHLEKQPFNMGEMVSSLIWAFKDTMDSKGLEFSLCIDPKTKQLLSSYDLLGDKHRVRQVLANYLSNATKFTPRGGKVTLKIVCNGTSTVDCPSRDGLLVEELETFTRRLGLSKSGKCLSVKTTDKVASITVFVEDTGIGISKEDQAVLFEPYIQISASSSQGGGGTGLGLSFAKRIVELAGGKIGVFSEVGKGSVFEFSMPFQLVEYVKSIDGEEMQKFSEDMRSKYPVFRSPSNNSLAVKPKILVVEDNLLNRRIIRKLLESLDLDNDDAENGKQAVDLVSEGRSYDMILIDKEMPVMDGHEATRQLRALGVKAPIIGLTGNALNSDRNEFIAAGVDDFFTKPISRHQLVKLLEAYGLIPKMKEKLHVRASMLPDPDAL